MKSVRGRYDGNVVVLNEPVPVNHEVEVIVQFPEDFGADVAGLATPQRWHWEVSRARQDSLRGTVSEEMYRQRQGK